MSSWNNNFQQQNNNRSSGNSDDILRKIFVGGLPQQVDEHMFKAYFSKYGEVEDCIVLKNKNVDPPISKGFGFVTFKNESTVDEVLGDSSEKHVIGDKEVDVKRAVPKDHTPCTKVFVGGLPDGTNEEEMKRFFEQHAGPVTQCQYKRDQATQRGRGFGFVTFEKTESADKLLVRGFIDYKSDNCPKPKRIEVRKAEENKNARSQGNPSVFGQPQMGHPAAGPAYAPPPGYPQPVAYYPPPAYYPTPAVPGAPAAGAAPGYPAPAAYPAAYPAQVPAGYPAAAYPAAYPGTAPAQAAVPAAAPAQQPNLATAASPYYQQQQYGAQTASSYGAQKAGYNASNQNTKYRPY